MRKLLTTASYILAGLTLLAFLTAVIFGHLAIFSNDDIGKPYADAAGLWTLLTIVFFGGTVFCFIIADEMKQQEEDSSAES